jgi:hypothetical protein
VRLPFPWVREGIGRSISLLRFGSGRSLGCRRRGLEVARRGRRSGRARRRVGLGGGWEEVSLVERRNRGRTAEGGG